MSFHITSTPSRSWLRFVFVASICFAQESTGQQRSSDHQPEVHHWVILLDVSLSAEDRDKRQSGPLAQEDTEYRLRNEVLALTRMLLGALGEVRLEEREDYLKGYIFGRGLETIDLGGPGVVEWDTITAQSTRDYRIPVGMGDRTEIHEALEEAVRYFSDLPEEARLHLFLISDGELDVGDLNRNPGTPPKTQEVEVYKKLFERRNSDSPLEWLRRRQVAVHSICIDVGFAPEFDDDTVRQTQLGTELNRWPGDTSGEKVLALIAGLAENGGLSPRLPRSEGPYVMRAIADVTGGFSRSVRPDTVLSVVWQSAFPDKVSHDYVAPGTGQVIVLAPIEAKLTVHFGGRDRTQSFMLSYDPERQNFVRDPSDIGGHVEVRFKLTAQFILWLLRAPNLRKIEGPQVEVAQVNDIELDWVPRSPPRETWRGDAVPLALDLNWVPGLPGSGVNLWRNRLRDEDIFPDVRVYAPGGSEPIDVPMSVGVPTGTGDTVLSLRGVFRQTQALGNYRVEANLVFSSGDEAWEENLPGASFNVRQFVRPTVTPTPEPTPTPIVTPPHLYVFTMHGDRPGPPVLIAPSKPGVTPVVEFERGASRALRFEWHWEAGAVQYLTPDALKVQVLDIRRQPLENSLPSQQPEEGPDGSTIMVYRSETVLIPPTLDESNLPIVAIMGAEKHTYFLKLKYRHRSWGERWNSLRGGIINQKDVIISIATLLGGLVAVLVLREMIWNGIVRSGSGIRNSWEDWRGHDAKFRFYISNGHAGINWEEGDPKRILIVPDDQYGLRARIDRRVLGSATDAVELRPIAKLRYKLKPISNETWEFRIRPTGASSTGGPSDDPQFQILGRNGCLLRYHELIHGGQIEIKRGNDRICIAYGKPPITTDRTDEGA